MPLGDNLKRIRKSCGLTQAELAQRLFVTAQAVSKWELGESEPDIRRICDLAHILKVSADVLLGISPSQPPALLAVDGGGTKTEFVLITPEGRLLQRLVLPGSNPNNIPLSESFQILCQGIDHMAVFPYGIQGIFIGCAGMGAGNNAKAMLDLLNKRYPGIRLRCDSDIQNILACAADPDNTIAAICGTGSVVFSSTAGELMRSGGGGWLLDPAGSGYGIGKDALLAALEARDGTGADTALIAAVEQQLGDTVWHSVPAIYEYTTGQVAAFAPLTIDAWLAGDPVATRIIDIHAGRLAYLIACARKKSPLAQDVLLGGSLLTDCAPFRELVQKKLPDDITALPIPYPPVWGACLQCAKLCALPRPDFQLFQNPYERTVKSC